MRRRALLAGLAGMPLASLAGVPLVGLAGMPLAGCAAPEDLSAKLWHGGELTIGTGHMTGACHQLGAAYADLINQHLTGFDVTAAPSGGSIDNLQRLASGDVEIALTLAAVAGDANRGTGLWESRPQPVRALARMYDNYEHVIARVDSGIATVAGMRGHKISLGSPNSGSDLLGRRLLTAAGLDPAKDVTPMLMPLPQTTAAILGGSIDAMIWSGGLPTSGISEMFAKGSRAVRFIKIEDILPKIGETYPNLMHKAVIPKDVYSLPEDVPTLVDANLIVVSPSMPNDLAYQLTKLIFDFQRELARVTPAAGAIRRELAPMTEPVPLHPGAQRYYRSATR